MFSLDWESKVKILHTISFIISKETINISILMDNYLFKQVPSLVNPLEEQFLDHFQAIVICNWDNIVPLCFDSRSPKMNMHGQKWIRLNILKRHILKSSYSVVRKIKLCNYSNVCFVSNLKLYGCFINSSNPEIIFILRLNFFFLSTYLVLVPSNFTLGVDEYGFNASLVTCALLYCIMWYKKKTTTKIVSKSSVSLRVR